MNLIAALTQPIARFLHVLLTAYQFTLSLAFGQRCRFYPSCSRYAQACLVQYPLTVAVKKTVLRLWRCHPLHPGGIDLP